MFNRKLVIFIALLVFLALVGLWAISEDEPASAEQNPVESEAATVEDKTPTQSETADTLKESASELYVHPEGIFRVIPFADDYEENDAFTLFYNDYDWVIAYAFPETVSLSQDNLPDFIEQALNQTVIEADYIHSYALTNDAPEVLNDGFIAFFDYDSDDYGPGLGAIYLNREGLASGLILLTENYDDAALAWRKSVESFSVQSVTDTPANNATTKDESANQDNGLLADSGFRPAVDGFSFYNYSNDEVRFNLTAAELQRMFGDQVCTSLAGGNCKLTPPANQWLNQMNGYMNGGHCEGMAVLSSLFYYDQFEDVAPTAFGGQQTSALQLSNEALQREIAYWWTTQGVYPTASHLVDESPQVVLDTLVQSFQQGQAAAEIWAMGIYKSDFTGGHAITPFAVENKGNGLFHILVYDNNFPGETRAVQVDTNSNTWQYQASTNPDSPEELYDGDATSRNLELVAIYPRLQQQQCPFCQVEKQGRLSGGLAAPAPEFYEIWLEGEADLLIIDDNGQRIGFDNGQFVNEIDGADTLNFRFSGVDVWDADNEPVYRVPVGTAFEIIVDGSRLIEEGVSDVSLIGPGFFVAVEELWLDAGEMDSIFVETDESRHHLTYATDYTDSPQMIIGVETDEADYAFMVQATELTGIEDTFDIAVDLIEGDFILDTSFNESDSTYEVYVLRQDDEGEHVFGSADLVMEPDTTLYLNYLEWIEEGNLMFADFDYDGDGEIDESLELEDEGDYDFFGAAEDE